MLFVESRKVKDIEDRYVYGLLHKMGKCFFTNVLDKSSWQNRCLSRVRTKKLMVKF
jgi:HD-like signal output (HDOD) protein